MAPITAEKNCFQESFETVKAVRMSDFIWQQLPDCRASVIKSQTRQRGTVRGSSLLSLYVINRLWSLEPTVTVFCLHNPPLPAANNQADVIYFWWRLFCTKDVSVIVFRRSVAIQRDVFYRWL